MKQQHSQEFRAHMLRVQRELLHARKMQALGELASGMAHDFNNVLSAISGYSELISRRYGEQNPGLQKYIQVILDSCGRAADMVEHLKGITRKDRRQERLFDASAALEELNVLSSRILPRRYRIQWVLPPHEQIMVLGDANAFQGLILHFLFLLRDLMPKGGDAMVIAGYQGDWLKLQFSLSNSQIHRTSVEKAFMQPVTADFSQQLGHTAFQVIQETMDSFHGTTMVRWDDEHSVRVILRFPKMSLHQELQKLDHQNRALLIGEAPQPSRVRKSTPLAVIVEDDMAIRDLLASLLGRRLPRLAAFSSAEEAWASLEEEDMVYMAIIDHGLPGKDGLTFAHQLRQKYEQIQIILTSGDIAFLEVKVAHLNHFDLLPKPFEIHQMQTLVDRVISQQVHLNPMSR